MSRPAPRRARRSPRRRGSSSRSARAAGPGARSARRTPRPCRAPACCVSSSWRRGSRAASSASSANGGEVAERVVEVLAALRRRLALLVQPGAERRARLRLSKARKISSSSTVGDTCPGSARRRPRPSAASSCPASAPRRSRRAASSGAGSRACHPGSARTCARSRASTSRARCPSSSFGLDLARPARRRCARRPPGPAWWPRGSRPCTR